MRPDARVDLGDLVLREEGGRHVAGWPSRGVFFEADAATVRALRLLLAGSTAREAEAALRDDTGEEHDVEGLVASLAASGLATAPGDARPARPLDARPRALAPLRSRAVVPAVLACAVATGALVAIEPRLAATPAQATSVSADPFVSFVATLAASLAIVLLHELGHWTFAYAHGIRSRVSLSARWGFPVVQTDVTRAWALPRGERLLIFLGGIAANVALAFATAALFVAWSALAGAPPSWALATARLVVFVNAFQIAYQLAVVLRSDLYFMLVAATGEWNLHADAARAIRRRASRVLRRVAGRPPAPEPDDTLPHDRTRLAAYAALLAIGSALGLALVAYTLASVARAFAPLVLGTLDRGFADGDWSAAAKGLVMVAYAGLLLVALVRFWIVGAARGLVAWWRETFPRAPAA